MLTYRGIDPGPEASPGPGMKPGGALLAVTLIALGGAGLLRADFAAILAPVSRAMPARDALINISGVVLLACGAGLLWRRASGAAARVLVVFLALWLLLVRARVILRAPGDAGSWESCGEIAVLVAAAWALYARTAPAWDVRHLAAASGARGVRLATVLYGLALVAFGVAHIAYLKETADLVPHWLPAPRAWVWLTGATYVAAGVALLAGRLIRLVTALSAVQIGAFTLLVWIPAVARGTADAGAWSECVISWTLTAAAWVLAEAVRAPVPIARRPD